MRLLLVRHGQSVWNAERLLQGQADIALSPQGQSQAQALAAIEQDPKVQLLIDRFEGTLDRDSVTPIKH